MVACSLASSCFHSIAIHFLIRWTYLLASSVLLLICIVANSDNVHFPFTFNFIHSPTSFTIFLIFVFLNLFCFIFSFLLRACYWFIYQYIFSFNFLFSSLFLSSYPILFVFFFACHLWVCLFSALRLCLRIIGLSISLEARNDRWACQFTKYWSVILH